jgi:hypothetical protein
MSPGAKRPWLIESDAAVHDCRGEKDDWPESGATVGRSAAMVGAASRKVISADGVTDPQRGQTDALSSSDAAQVAQGRTAAL